MSRLIDADALMEIYMDRLSLVADRYSPDSSECGILTGAMKLLDEQPTIDPEPKVGKWIPQNLNKSDGMISTAVYYYPKCSVCGASANYTNFCPNCGAKMSGADHD